MTEITLQSAHQLASLIAAGDLSPVEVVKAHRERFERLNPRINAIATFAPDAESRAREAEAALMRGENWGPLHGVPLTIKDTLATAGLLTTSGSRLRAQYVPDSDAPAVAKLKAAGAIILAKTNTAEVAMEYTADNPVFGRTNNPHNLSHSPGGSSGGEAAAIASGMSPAGLGTDLAGSIRIPAHCCGIAGLKPTSGRIPSGGQCPPATGPYSLGAAIGPMARTIADLDFVMSIFTSRSAAAPTLAALGEELRGTRVALYVDDTVSPVTAETREAVRRAAAALAGAGLVPEETLPPGIGRGYELWLKLFSRASVVQLRRMYSGHEEQGGRFVRWRLGNADAGALPTLDDFIAAWMERDELASRLSDWMTAVPLLLAPVGATTAPPHDALKLDVDGVIVNAFRAFSYSQAFNVYNLPAVCVPAGRSASTGLPIGVQIAGNPFQERQVLAAAAIVEAALGGWQHPQLDD